MFTRIINFRNKRAYKEIIIEYYKDLSIKRPHSYYKSYTYYNKCKK